MTETAGRIRVGRYEPHTLYWQPDGASPGDGPEHPIGFAVTAEWAQRITALSEQRARCTCEPELPAAGQVLLFATPDKVPGPDTPAPPRRAYRPPRQGPCGHCKATVLWVPTAASKGAKLMPLDIDITDDGTCYLVPAGDGSPGPWVQVVAPHAAIPPELQGEPRWSTHMWSCPGKTWQTKAKIGR